MRPESSSIGLSAAVVGSSSALCFRVANGDPVESVLHLCPRCFSTVKTSPAVTDSSRFSGLTFDFKISSSPFQCEE